jgi:hypothetical protein
MTRSTRDQSGLTNVEAPEVAGCRSCDKLLQERGLSRRALLGRAAALAGTAVTGSILLPGASRLTPLAQALAAGQDLALITLTPSDLSLAPERFAASGPAGQLALGFVWGFMQQHPNRPNAPVPIRHIRTFTPVASAGKAFARLSPDVTGIETGLHCGELTGAGPAPYTTLTGDPTGLTNDPFTYQVLVDGPHGYRYNWSTNYTKIVESNVLDVTVRHLPFGLCVNPVSVAGSNAFPISPWFVHFGIAEGTYAGRSVRYLAGTERLFAGGVAASFGNPSAFFIGGYFIGERSNGSLECAFVMNLFQDNGGTASVTDTLAFYIKTHPRSHEPLEVITSRNVHGEITFKQLNWANSPVVTRAIYQFAGKEIVFEPRWGFTGQDTCPGSTPQPIPGDSYGPWREIHSNDNFRLNLTYHESTCTSSQVSFTQPTVY